jgi:hypothetical protein
MNRRAFKITLSNGSVYFFDNILDLKKHKINKMVAISADTIYAKSCRGEMPYVDAYCTVDVLDFNKKEL